MAGTASDLSGPAQTLSSQLTFRCGAPAERLAHPKMGEPGCLEDITTLHAMPGFYIILPGHEIPDVEQVVKQAATYTIITGQTARTD